MDIEKIKEILKKKNFSFRWTNGYHDSKRKLTESDFRGKKFKDFKK